MQKVARIVLVAIAISASIRETRINKESLGKKGHLEPRFDPT